MGSSRDPPVLKPLLLTVVYFSNMQTREKEVRATICQLGTLSRVLMEDLVSRAGIVE